MIHKSVTKKYEGIPYILACMNGLIKVIHRQLRGVHNIILRYKGGNVTIQVFCFALNIKFPLSNVSMLYSCSRYIIKCKWIYK